MRTITTVTRSERNRIWRDLWDACEAGARAAADGLPSTTVVDAPVDIRVVADSGTCTAHIAGTTHRVRVTDRGVLHPLTRIDLSEALQDVMPVRPVRPMRPVRPLAAA